MHTHAHMHAHMHVRLQPRTHVPTHPCTRAPTPASKGVCFLYLASHFWRCRLLASAKEFVEQRRLQQYSGGGMVRTNLGGGGRAEACGVVRGCGCRCGCECAVAGVRVFGCVFSGACFRVRVFVCESVVSLICNTTIIRISKTS